jgi:hypothetical protein
VHAVGSTISAVANSNLSLLPNDVHHHHGDLYTIVKTSTMSKPTGRV